MSVAAAATAYCRELPERIGAALETEARAMGTAAGRATARAFGCSRDEWHHAGGGGGTTRVLRDRALLEARPSPGFDSSAIREMGPSNRDRNRKPRLD